MTRNSDSSETRRFSGRILALLAGVFAILIGGLELSPATLLTASAVAPKVVPDFAGGVELQGTGAALEGLLPARLLDTRGLGTVDGGGPLGALGQGSTIEIVVGGRGGVPDLGAGAVALNVTATDPTVPTFLTVWPTGEARPTASNLNVVAGMTAPNLVVVKLGKGGRVSVFNNGGSVDVVVDVAGWFPESAGLNPLVPARLADTRGLGTVDGAGPLGAVPQGGLAAVTVVGRAGVPLSGVDAVVLNVTAVSPTASTFLTVWPTGEPRPLASNLNIGPGEVRPNLVVAKVGIDGTVSVFNSAGFTDVVVDVAGWIATGAPLTTINPVRLADTRGLGTFDATGPVGKLGTAGVITLQISGRAGMPAAGVAVLNVTATESTLPTFLTVWPTGSPRPTASNLNLPAGDTRPNLVFAPIGANGTVSIFNNAGTVHVIVDLAGIFTIPTGGTNKITAASGTRFAGPGDVISTNLDASGAGTVTLAGSADVPPVGGFLIATNDGTGPAGIVVKIVAVALQSDGTTILTVTPAVLQEAVRLDDVHQSGPLQLPDEPDSLPPLVAESAQSVQSVQSAGSTTSGAIKLDLWTPNKFQKLTCSGGVNGTTEDLGFKVQLQNVNHEFEMVAAAQTGGYFMEGDVVLQTRIAVHTTISCAISFDLAQIPFTIPGVPVPFELNFKIGIDLTIEGGSSWTETSTYHFRVGSLYASGSWHTSNTVYRVAKTATNVVPEGAITLKPYIEANLYIGSSTAVAAGLRFTVAFPFSFGVEWSIPDNQNCATLTFKIELELELALKALGGRLDATLSLAKWTVWPTVPPKVLYKHCFAGPPPTTTTTTTSPGATTTTAPGTPGGGAPGTAPIAAGAYHSCALLADTTVKCWGGNGLGQLGNGTNTNSNTAVTVSGVTGATAIAAGAYHSCALLADTTVKCWGYNARGQLGNGTNIDSDTAVTVSGITGAVAITAGDLHSCALLADTTVKCWGYNYLGQLGNGTNIDSDTAVTVSGITGATAIAAGEAHSCALLADTTVKCWGHNARGQLGNGTNIDSDTAVTVSGITGAVAITAGYEHSCALLADTTVKCWGWNGYGQLGNGTNIDSDTAVTVSGITGATAIAAGDAHSCALLADTTVKCWGNNYNGALGNGTNTDSNTAVTVSGVAGVTALAAEVSHSCALLADTTVKCWGYNIFGQLGNGTNTDSNTAVTVTGL